MATTTVQRINGYRTVAADNNVNLKWTERYISIAAGVQLSFSGLKHLFKSPFTSLIKLGAAGYLMNRVSPGTVSCIRRQEN